MSDLTVLQSLEVEELPSLDEMVVQFHTLVEDDMLERLKAGVRERVEREAPKQIAAYTERLSSVVAELRKGNYSRQKPTTSGGDDAAPRRRFVDGWTEWSFCSEPGIAAARRPSRKPVRHEHGLHEIGFISESTVDSGDVGIVIGFDPGVKSCAINCGGKLWKLEEVDTPPFKLPDLKSLYSEDWDFYAKLQKQIAESMGLPASMVSVGPKLGGMGRYYSERIVELPPLKHYSFEET